MKEPPILRDKDFEAPSVFKPENLLREGRRQLDRLDGVVPDIVLLDPDGDILKWLRDNRQIQASRSWACYHTTLYEFDHDGFRLGIIGQAVGASFAVLLAEQLMVSGCKLLLSMTSAGKIGEQLEPPCFLLIDKALRDEGTSYHYLAPSQFARLSEVLLLRLRQDLVTCPHPLVVGSTWTTDAPYRETQVAISAAQTCGIQAVEMEAAALYAFAEARNARIVCFAHITNEMAQDGNDFEKGTDSGAVTSLDVLTWAVGLLEQSDSD